MKASDDCELMVSVTVRFLSIMVDLFCEEIDSIWLEWESLLGAKL